MYKAFPFESYRVYVSPTGGAEDGGVIARGLADVAAATIAGPAFCVQLFDGDASLLPAQVWTCRLLVYALVEVPGCPSPDGAVTGVGLPSVL
jgi:hypothetical protein